MAKETPKCVEVAVSSSVGGKMQIVKFEYSADFHYSMSRKYEVPTGWTEQDARDFQQDKVIELRGQLEGIAQAEVDELTEQRNNA